MRSEIYFINYFREFNKVRGDIYRLIEMKELNKEDGIQKLHFCSINLLSKISSIFFNSGFDIRDGIPAFIAKLNSYKNYNLTHKYKYIK